MPKRIIHGEGVWHSDKLAQVQPPDFRAEYTWLLPLALANGVFECNSRCVWATAYAFNRPEVTVETVEKILAEFGRVHLLFRWQEPDGKTWGYWTGIRKPGRLPSPSRLKKHHELGPEPPQELLGRFEEVEVANAQPAVNHQVADSHLGFGVGVGVGMGKNITSKPDSSDQSACEPSETPAHTKLRHDAVLAEHVQSVWHYYIEIIGRNPELYTFTSRRKAMGVARLRDLIKRSGSIERGLGLMRLCVDRLKQSPFHNGKNDQQKKYLDWEILFRSTEQMEKWLDDERWTNLKGVA
jgi:hypothetical protein